jgi:hypothetical protein
MGIERMRSPKYWLMRAEEFHTKADNRKYPESRDSLRQAAENYEELARQAQQLLDAKQSSEHRRLVGYRLTKEYAKDQRAISQLRQRMN